MVETESMGKKVILAVVIAVLVTVIVLVILAGLGYASKYYKNNQYNDQVEATMNKLPPTAYDQKEFPKPYMEWLAKYCVPENSGKYSKFSEQQVPEYCACIIDKRVHSFTMKEQVEAQQARWDPKVVPDALKKYNDSVAECTQKILSGK